MIKNIPEPDDFYISSMNYLNMAWGVAIEIQSAMTEISHSNLEREEVEAFKKSNKFYLNNCLMLVHQAVELYLKFRISEVNPLLLVDLKNGDKDADFSDLVSIGAKQLIKVHDSVIPKKLGRKVEKVYNDIRIKRNKIMHSTGRVLQEEGGIISQILYISKYLLDKPWLEIRAEFLTGRRYLGHDTSLEQINSEFEHCLEVLNEQDVRFLLGVTRSDLKFFCPMCSEHFEGLSQYKTLGTKEKEGAVCVICKRVAQFEDFKCVDCNLSAVDSDYYSCLSCLTEYEKEV